MTTETDTKDPYRLNPQQNMDNNKLSNMKKETVRLLLTPTVWICLELLNLFLVQTGMKYADLTEIGKGGIITTRKASHIAWKSNFVYHLLRSHTIPDTLAYEAEKCLEMRLSPHKRLQGIFVLQYL